MWLGANKDKTARPLGASQSFRNCGGGR
jgi:hypothetical protein